MLTSRSRARRTIAGAGALGALLIASPGTSIAQNNTECDFDIADHIGTYVSGNTIHLTGRAGAGTIVGQFVITNDTSNVGDLDRDGYSPQTTVIRNGVPTLCNYNDLLVPDFLRVDLVNTEDPAIAIPGRNIIVTDLPRSLQLGQQARVDVFVELPRGTPAGRYIGRFGVSDAVLLPRLSPTGEVLGVDAIEVEVVVVAEPAITAIDDETDAPLDSVVVRGRAGTRASRSFRLANSGNAPLSGIQLSATELRSESAVGLVIPATAVSFSPNQIPGMILTDTTRVTVTVAIPRGILGGRYRGSIIVQSEGTTAQQIPLIVIVTSTRGILFANNPVRAQDGIATIAFNGDPGTGYKIGIFDMTGRMVFDVDGVVFAGTGGSAGAPGAGADFAQSVTWSLVNGRGEPVASGMYLVVVESIVNGARTLARDRLMVIR